MSSRNDPPHKRLLTFEQHSFPLVSYVTNHSTGDCNQHVCSREFDCFREEHFDAFRKRWQCFSTEPKSGAIPLQNNILEHCQRVIETERNIFQYFKVLRNIQIKRWN